MTTTSLTARPNMTGTKKRLIQAAVRDLLTKQLQRFDGESGDQLEANLGAFLADINAAVVRHSAKAPKLFSEVSTYVLAAIAGKPTKQCCVGKLWYYRDGDFDNRLSADQSGTDSATITVLTSMKDWTFREVAVAVLNVSPDTSDAVIGTLLKERGHTMTLAQAVAMVEATERREKTGLRTDGYCNCFFMENEDGSVSVVCVARNRHLWRANVLVQAYDTCWYAGNRLMV